MSRPFFNQGERSAVFHALRLGLAGLLTCAAILLLALITTYSADDPNALNATEREARNLFGAGGAQLAADLLTRLGLGAYTLVALALAWAIWIVRGEAPAPVAGRLAAAPLAIGAVSGFASAHVGQIAPGAGLGGYFGDICFRLLTDFVWLESPRARMVAATIVLTPVTAWLLLIALGGRLSDVKWAARRSRREIGEATRMLGNLIGGDRQQEVPIYHGEPPQTPPFPPRRNEQSAQFRREEPPVSYWDASEPQDMDAWREDDERERARLERPDWADAPYDPEPRQTELFEQASAPLRRRPPTPINRQIGDGEPDFYFQPAVSDASAEPTYWRGEMPGPDANFTADAPAKPPTEPEQDAPAQRPQAEFERALDDEWRSVHSAPPTAPKRRAPRRPAEAGGWTIGRAAPGYAPPALDLLETSHDAPPPDDLERRLAERAEHLQRVIEEFSVRGDVIDANPGPVVTQFELEPGPGVKVSRVVGLTDDIARAMSAVSARVTTVPGKHVIAVELPNDERQTIRLRSLLEDPKFIAHSGALPIALGCNLIGSPVVIDLASAPHLLIAGATGSGKSVAVNAILLSLLYRLNPTELRLLLIDPKMLELSVYNGAPHLISPVVTDAKSAVSALKWAVREMERRYELMSKIGVRAIDGYNARAETLRRSGGAFEVTVENGQDPETGEPIIEQQRIAPDPMARIVIVIDELADLMMVAGKEIEHCVLRLAQMGRASGLHVIAATQRPSVDVITGLIKSNFPTRISFQTASAADSKTILDRPGAERLLGRGDMLYSPGGGRLERLHGPFVSDAEVMDAAAHLRRQGAAPDLLVFDGADNGAADYAEHSNEDSDDSLYDRAVQIVLDEHRASASFLQRRLQVGYNRASRLIEQMERDGVVSPLTSAGKREVLAPRDAVAAK
ncbi:MAG: DNA translocase FtsK [Neomegalonema sp.]|nr:DNA translocase FtsK [Neomegalonema sp.]